MKYFVAITLFFFVIFIGSADYSVYATEPKPVGINVLDYGIFDANDDDYVITHELVVGQEYKIKTKFESELDVPVTFSYNIQIIDKNKHWTKTVDEFKAESFLQPNEIHHSSFGFVPQYAGSFRTFAVFTNIMDGTTIGAVPQYDFEVIKPDADDLRNNDKSFSLYEKQVKYNIPYSISNGMINDMTLFCEHGSLLIDVSSQSKSDIRLEIELPRNMLDPKTNDKDSRFFVLRDGEEINYEEIPYKDYRKLSMSFPHNTNEIEIIHAFILALKPPMCKVVDNPPYSLILPPLQQFKSGVPTDEIQCKDGLTMLLTPKDSRPVCVTVETAEKLIPRNWGIIVSRG